MSLTLTPSLPSMSESYPVKLEATNLPPTNLPPTNLPPTNLPPTNLPPTSLPPTGLPPTGLPPTSLPPTSLPPTSLPPTSLPPTVASVTSALSLSVPTPPASAPAAGNPTPSSAPSVSSAAPVHPNTKSTSSTQHGTTTTKTNISQPVCRNCKTQTTPLWRRDETGQVLCNACGLFLKLHGRPRPISLKTDVIKSRNRVKNQPNHSSPNTPELKAKEGKVGGGNGSGADPQLPPMAETNSKFSPKQYRPKEHSAEEMRSASQWFTQAHPHFQTQHVPLGYPSSTPTQFAPNLKAITSPLLLASVGPYRHPHGPTNLLARVAAGELENLNQHAHVAPVHAQMAPVHAPIRPLHVQATPLLAMTESHHHHLPHLSLHTPPPPKLPILAGDAVPVASLPLFGPQYALSGLSGFSLNASTPSLPSLKPMLGRSATTQTVYHHHHEPGLPLPGPISSIREHLNGKPQLSSNQLLSSILDAVPVTRSSSTDETTQLRTRISELELVNDLYKSRIAELELSELQARVTAERLRKEAAEAAETKGAQPVVKPPHRMPSPLGVEDPVKHPLEGLAEGGQSPKRSRVEVMN